MFDLQVQAFAADTTRVAALKLGLDGSPRVYPGSGVNEGFHAASHHSQREGKIETFARINRYHVSHVPYFLEKLQSIREGDGTLLDKTLVLNRYVRCTDGKFKLPQSQALSAVSGRTGR